MKTTNVIFEEINTPLDWQIIDKLGKEFAPTHNDKSMFIIKTVHQDEKFIPDKTETCGFKTETYIEEKTFVMNVFKIANGWMGTIDGHFSCDYKGYTITHISKLEF